MIGQTVRNRVPWSGSLLFCFIFAMMVSYSPADVLEKTVSNAAELEELFAAPVDSAVVTLLPGLYELVADEIIDSTCGNCEDPQTLVSCTVGLQLSGSFVHLTGPEDRSAIIRTNAGYGLFLNNCRSAIIENLTITGGKRDPGAHATNAGIVAKNSTAIIRSNRITANIGDPWIVESNVVGIMGICGRENSDLTIRGNEITGNSWDGIALYRDAYALIEGNIVDGVDKAKGNMIGGGRGVGIGVTWNAKAEIRHNLVKRYWKGIGLFVDARGVVEENIVEDIITWGISLWDAGKGVPVGYIRRNIIYYTGACGASITSSTEQYAPGEFTGNIIVESGQTPKYDEPDYYCYQTALSLQAIPSRFIIAGNVFSNNRRGTSDLPDWDMDASQFVQDIRTDCIGLLEHDVFRTSDFVKDFCFQR